MYEFQTICRDKNVYPTKQKHKLRLRLRFLFIFITQQRFHYSVVFLLLLLPWQHQQFHLNPSSSHASPTTHLTHLSTILSPLSSSSAVVPTATVDPFSSRPPATTSTETTLFRRVNQRSTVASQWYLKCFDVSNLSITPLSLKVFLKLLKILWNKLFQLCLVCYLLIILMLLLLLRFSLFIGYLFLLSSLGNYLISPTSILYNFVYFII